MAFFKDKGEKESEKIEKLDKKMAQYGLESLSLEDKERVKLTMMNLWGTTLISVGSKAEDSAKISLLQALVEQNFMIIKLLNEIKNK